MRKVSEKMINLWCDENDIPFFMTSTVTGQNVREMYVLRYHLTKHIQYQSQYCQKRAAAANFFSIVILLVNSSLNHLIYSFLQEFQLINSNTFGMLSYYMS